jgi:hypothetical protein
MSETDNPGFDVLDPVQPLDISVPLLLQIVPLELRDGHLGSLVPEPIIRGFTEVIGHVGRVPHDLLRDASWIDTITSTLFLVLS